MAWLEAKVSEAEAEVPEVDEHIDTLSRERPAKLLVAYTTTAKIIILIEAEEHRFELFWDIIFWL